MAIAAHIKDDLKNPSALYPFIIRLASLHPAEHFVIFSSKNKTRAWVLPTNCELVRVMPPIKNHLLRYYWYQYKLPNLLEKYNISHFISEDNSCNLKIKTPQSIFIKQLYLPSSKNQQKYIAHCYKKAASVLVSNPLVKKNLLLKHGDLQEKTTLLYPGINGAYLPLPAEKKQMLLNQLTAENEFFIYESPGGSIDNKIIVLKAFSIFKKRLKSSMQLIILDQPGAEPIPDFKNYKYREAVKIICTTNEEELRDVQRAAYAAIFFNPGKNNTETALHYSSSGVPLIVSDFEFNHLVYGAAVLYTKMEENTLAENIMALYKDETLSKTLISKGTTLADMYNWEESCSCMAESILPAGRF